MTAVADRSVDQNRLGVNIAQLGNLKNLHLALRDVGEEVLTLEITR